jgi:hypothetical protein
MATPTDDDRIRGSTIRWTFSDGPMAGKSFEHSFRQDGTVVWRVLNGTAAAAAPQQPAEGVKYAAFKVSDSVYALSYLSASGYTLTVVLNFGTRQMCGFASNDQQWFPLNGSFETT